MAVTSKNVSLQPLLAQYLFHKIFQRTTNSPHYLLNHLVIQSPNQIHNQIDVNGIHRTHYIQSPSQEAFFDCQNTFTIRCWEVENIHGGGVQLPTLPSHIMGSQILSVLVFHS